MSRWLRYGLPVVVTLVALGMLWVRTAPDERPAMVDPDASATYGDLVLDSADGPLRLSDLRGKVVVVYFGYTSCPDICPTTMQTMAAAFDRLSQAQQDELALILVSVDPERDELSRLQDYARYFHPHFHAGSADPDAVARMAADWGVQYRRVQTEGSAMAYTVDHSTQAFLVGRQGELVQPIAHGTSATEVARLLEVALDADRQGPR